jgi:biopolymer transport protein ExbB
MHRVGVFLLAVCVWIASTAAIPSVTYAQDDVAAAQADKEEGSGGQSYFMWVARSSGLIGLFILGLSVYFIATVIRLFMDFRPELVAPPEVVAQVSDLIAQRNFRGVYDYVREEGSFLSNVLTAGIVELPNGLADAREAMDRAGEAETVEMEKRISILAVLGTLGPMIGLLGTLKGMIASFSVIAMSDVTLKASEVAGGISEALLLTFEGVMLSVPAIYFFAVFRNRVSHLSVNTMLQADELLRHLAQAAKNKTPPQARAGAAV